MRAARVPASLAISSAAHYIITATDRSESYQKFMQKHREQEEKKERQEQEQSARRTNIKTNDMDSVKRSKKKSLRFRLHHLVAADWSELMHQCRGLTHPANAYTISSPGDAGDVISNIFAENNDSSNNNNENSSSAENESTSANRNNNEVHVVNTAIMHIVERVPSDFVPNNLIYHRLRQYDIESTNWHGVIPGFDEFVCALQHTTSEDDVHRQKEKNVPWSLSNVTSATDKNNETKVNINNKNSEEDGNRDEHNYNNNLDEELNLPASDKREHDALAHNSEAHIASISNEQIGVQISSLVRQLQVNLEQQQQEEKKTQSQEMLLQSEQMKHNMEIENAQTPQHSLTFTFYPHRIDALACIPFCSRHFAVVVNLKPIVPLHLMVVPLRCVSTIHGLSDEEVSDWGHVVHLTISVLENIRQEKCSPLPKETAALTSAKTQSEAVALGNDASTNTSKDENIDSSTRLNKNNTAVDADKSTIHKEEHEKSFSNTNNSENNKEMEEVLEQQEQCGVVHDGGYSIAIQQGALAGQTVAHLHTHIIPFDPTGVLAGEPEYEGEAEAQRRPPRTVAEMRAETLYLRPYFAKL